MSDAAPAGERRISRTFPPDPSEVFSARHFVAAALEDWGLECDDLPLLVSELATNAVLHARSDFEVTVVQPAARRVRVEVFDQNTRLPYFAVAPPDAYSGRGLMLLRELASAWGVESHSDDGKTIWFELELPDQHQPVRAPSTL
jgi:anti-sigma regulatory factor (Ser/Thr protein kinase)